MQAAVYARVATQAQLEAGVRTAAYCRSATDPGRDGADGVDSQLKRIQAYCAEHNLSLCAIFIDSGCSGMTTLDRRIGGTELLEQGNYGRFSLLVVTELNRLSRDPRHLRDAIAQLNAVGVHCQTVDGHFNSADPVHMTLLQEV